MDLPRFAPLLVVVAVAGCAPYATYPPLDEKIHLSQPTFAPFPELMARGLRAGQEHFEDPNELVINLPAGTPPIVYKKVIDRLGEGRPMTAPDDRAYHVIEVRTRATRASVDVICPRSDGLYSLLTVDFSNDVLHGYRVVHTRVWRIHVDTPPPHYAPPPPEQGVEAYASYRVDPWARP